MHCSDRLVSHWSSTLYPLKIIIFMVVCDKNWWFVKHEQMLENTCIKWQYSNKTIITVQEEDERSFPQNTKPNQSKTKHLHYTSRTIHKHTQISSKSDSTPLNLIHPLWITDWKPTKLNNIKWNSPKSNSTRGPQRGGIEVK